jgi:hypothetical protein
VAVTRKVVVSMLCAAVGALGQGTCLNCQSAFQGRPELPEAGPRDPKLPDGTSQREAILKADHAKSLKDADELLRLTTDLKEDLEKNDRHVLSVATLKKLDDIEKLTKRIRGRMKRM